MSLLKTTLNNSRTLLALASNEFAADNWGADSLRSIYDLLDSWYTQSDIHRCYTRKMECLQGHLRARFTNRLGPDSTNGGTYNRLLSSNT